MKTSMQFPPRKSASARGPLLLYTYYYKLFLGNTEMPVKYSNNSNNNKIKKSERQHLRQILQGPRLNYTLSFREFKTRIVHDHFLQGVFSALEIIIPKNALREQNYNTHSK